MGLDEGGTLYGPLKEAQAFQRWMELQKRRIQAPASIPLSPAEHNVTVA